MKNFITLSLIVFLSINGLAQINYRSTAPDFNSKVHALIPWGDSVIIKKELGKEVLASGTHFLVGTNGYSKDAVGNPDIFGKQYQVENGFLFHIGRRLHSNVSDQLVKVNLADGNTDYLELPIETQGLTNGSKVVEMEIFNGFIYILADNLSVGRKILRIEASSLSLDNVWNNAFNQNPWVSEIQSIDLVNDQLVFLSENSGSYGLQGYDLNNQNVSQLANVQPFGFEGMFSDLTAVNDTLFTYPVNVNGVGTQYFYSSNGYSNNIQVTGEIAQSFVWNGSFYLAGNFQINGQSEYLVELDLSSNTLQPIQGFNGNIKYVSPTANQIEILGNFTAYNGVAVNGKVLLDQQLNLLYDFTTASISGNKDHAYINGSDTLFIGRQLKVMGGDLAEEIIYNPSTNQFEDVPNYLQGKIENGVVKNDFLYYQTENGSGTYEYFSLDLTNGQIAPLGVFQFGGKEVFTDFESRLVFADEVFNPTSQNAYIVAHDQDNFLDTIHVNVPYLEKVLDITNGASRLYVMGSTIESNPELRVYEFQNQSYITPALVFSKGHDGPGYGVYRGAQIEYNSYQNWLSFGFAEEGTMQSIAYFNYLFDLNTNTAAEWLSGQTGAEEPEYFDFNALVNTQDGIMAAGSGIDQISIQTISEQAANGLYLYGINTGFQFTENSSPNFRDSVRLNINHLVGTPNYIYGGADHPGLRAFVVFERSTTYTSVKESDVLTSALSTLNVYPVPADKQLNIELNNEQNQTVQICDLAGRVILQQRLNSGLNALDISELNSGVYFVILPETGETVKWIKH
mgnify:CR=1 FL=1